jgi:hypothetical protein
MTPLETRVRDLEAQLKDAKALAAGNRRRAIAKDRKHATRIREDQGGIDQTTCQDAGNSQTTSIEIDRGKGKRRIRPTEKVSPGGTWTRMRSRSVPADKENFPPKKRRLE